MPYSYGIYKQEVKDWIYTNFDETARILDIGAGSGTYWNMLNDKFKHIDCVEVFIPYIKQFKLEEKYENVFVANITDFKYSNYDLIIFGDIIEHLKVNDAQYVLKYAYDRCENFIVAVPYLYEQGECYGNKHEMHKQPDLTPDLVIKRYPYLQLLYGDDKYGYYVKQPKKKQ